MSNSHDVLSTDAILNRMTTTPDALAEVPEDNIDTDTTPLLLKMLISDVPLAQVVKDAVEVHIEAIAEIAALMLKKVDSPDEAIVDFEAALVLCDIHEAYLDGVIHEQPESVDTTLLKHLVLIVRNNKGYINSSMGQAKKHSDMMNGNDGPPGLDEILNLISGGEGNIRGIIIQATMMTTMSNLHIKDSRTNDQTLEYLASDHPNL